MTRSPRTGNRGTPDKSCLLGKLHTQPWLLAYNHDPHSSRTEPKTAKISSTRDVLLQKPRGAHLGNFSGSARNPGDGALRKAPCRTRNPPRPGRLSAWSVRLSLDAHESARARLACRRSAERVFGFFPEAQSRYGRSHRRLAKRSPNRSNVGLAAFWATWIASLPLQQIASKALQAGQKFAVSSGAEAETC